MTIKRAGETMRKLALDRPRTAGLWAALSMAVLPMLVTPAQSGASAITCTNPISGASWQINIDYDQATVDSNPASITDVSISWRDGKNGWRYSLDRKSGNLTVTLASATGGNFLYDRCKLDN
jgi:hypothetical protein